MLLFIFFSKELGFVVILQVYVSIIRERLYMKGVKKVDKEIKFYEALKQMREERKISQAALAKKIGIDQTAISKYERNIQLPEVRTLVKIAELFDTSVDELIFSTGFTRNELLLKEKIEKNIPVEDLLNDSEIHLTRNGKPLTGAELSVVIATLDAMRSQSI